MKSDALRNVEWEDVSNIGTFADGRRLDLSAFLCTLAAHAFVDMRKSVFY